MLIRFAAAALVAVSSVTWPAPPPPAPVRPVIDHLADGQTVSDPYRYMENLKSPEVQAYFKRESDYTNAVLAKLGPARTKLQADIGRLVDAGSTVSGLNRVNDRLFYLERPAGANDARLMVKIGAAAPRVLLDPDALGKSLGLTSHLTIEGVVPSFDGGRVAVGIVTGGAERDTHTRIIDVATGALLAEDIPRSYASAWSPDGTVLFYGQLPKVGPGHENEAELNSQVMAHVVGSTTPDADVFGINHDPKVAFVPTDFPGIATSPASTWAFGVIEHGVQNEQTIYAVPLTALLAGGTIPWRKIADVDDDVTGFDVRGDKLYLLSHKDAPNYKVAVVDLAQPAATAATATTIVPQGAGVILGVAVAKDALYVRGIKAGPAELRKLPFGADGALGPIAPVPLPFAGTLGDFTTDARVDGATFGFATWTRPLLVYALDANGMLADTGVRKAPNIDTSGYVSREVMVPSTGGVMVPVSIVMNRGTKLDGSNAT